MSPDVREFVILEGFQVPSRLPTENNHQGNQRLLLVRNTAVGEEKKNRTIKAAVQPASGIGHPKTCMGMLEGNLSTKMIGLGSISQSEESNYTVAEAMEEYLLASTEAAYGYPGEQAPMVCIASGGGFQYRSYYHWWEQKHPSFPSQNFSENTNWETASRHMSMD